MATRESTQAEIVRTHQWITYKNTDERQTFVLIDRFKQSHPLLPGQTKEIDMAADEVESFRANTRPGRGCHT
jgi:hypothetical protein